MTEYRLSFSAALVLHLVLLGFLIFDFSHPTPQKFSLQVNQKVQSVIHAVAIDQREVEKQIAEINAHKSADDRHHRKMLQQLAKAQQERIKEQKRLAKLKQKLKQTEYERLHQSKLADKKLKALQQKQQDEQNRLTKLQKQTERAKREANKNAELALQKKKLAEQQEKESAEKVRQQAQLGRVMNRYKALILQAISRNWIIPDATDKQLACKLLILLSPDGMVLNVKLLESSGDSLLDRSAMSAVYKSSPLPVPTEADLLKQFKSLRLTMRPEEVLSIL